MISRTVLEELRDFDTSLLANTICAINDTPAHEIYLSGEIQSVTPALGPTVGIAFTCELDSSTPENVEETSLHWDQLQQMADSDLPIVWVVKTTGSRPHHECVIGNGMAKILYSVGCQGLVSAGRVRDIQGLLTTPFAAYCRGRAVHHVPLRFQSINRPVEVGGVTISPGDVIHANSEGVIRIPPKTIPNLVESAIRMRTFEYKVHTMLRRTDLTPSEKRQLVGELVAEFGFRDCVSSNGRA